MSILNERLYASGFEEEAGKKAKLDRTKLAGTSPVAESGKPVGPMDDEDREEETRRINEIIEAAKVDKD